MIAYLDYNIFTGIETGEFTLEQVIKNVNPQIDTFPYSYGHIFEVNNIVCKTEEERCFYIRRKLEVIKKITDCCYVHQDYQTKENQFFKKDPIAVFETISESSLGNTARKLFVNLFSREQKETIRREIGIDVKQINNYDAKQVIGHLNKKLNSWGQGLSLIDFVEKSISYYKNKDTFGLYHRVAGIMELLDMLGYWKDRETETSNDARLWDSHHTYFASLFDYFISDDKRTRYKARVVYEIYGIRTKVISSQGEE